MEEAFNEAQQGVLIGLQTQLAQLVASVAALNAPQQQARGGESTPPVGDPSAGDGQDGGGGDGGIEAAVGGGGGSTGGNGDDEGGGKGANSEGNVGGAEVESVDSLLLNIESEDGDGPARPLPGEATGHPDGFDRPRLPGPKDFFNNFGAPKRVRRADGLPVPFRPTDPEHLEAFPPNDPDHDEANSVYLACTWAEAIANAALALYHERDTVSKAEVDQRLTWMAVATRLHYRICAARYDYLQAAKDEPGLAELYRATDAVPRNCGRGPGFRRFLEAVAVDESRAFSKKAAERHANDASRRRRRGKPNNPGPGTAPGNPKPNAGTPGGAVKNPVKPAKQPVKPGAG